MYQTHHDPYIGCGFLLWLRICTQKNMVYHTSRSHDSTPCAWTGNCSAIDITNVIATRNIEARWQMWRGRRITRRRSWRSCWWNTTWVHEVVKSVVEALTWLVRFIPISTITIYNIIHTQIINIQKICTTICVVLCVCFQSQMKGWTKIATTMFQIIL